MAGKYRGVLKVAGSVLRGWLVDTVHPARHLRFNLVIDGQPRGSYVADRRRRSLIRQEGVGEHTHGFSIPIRRVWISGAVQSIRIEDPAERAFELSLSAMLGPVANRNFEEHVVSGQVSIGEREHSAHGTPHAAAAPVEEDRHSDPRASASARKLLKQIGALADGDLVELLLSVDREILLERIARHDKAGDWQSALAFRRLFLGGASEQLLLAYARSAIKAHNYVLAGRITAAVAALHPQSFDALHLAGVAKSHQGESDAALAYLRGADALERGTCRAKREMVVLLGKLLRAELPAQRRAEIRAEHLGLLRELSASEDANIRVRYRVPFAAALFAAGRYDEAIAAADEVLGVAPNDTKALTLKARALIARNAIGEAHALYERILELEPDHRGAQTNLGVLAALMEDEALDQRRADAAVMQAHRQADTDDGKMAAPQSGSLLDHLAGLSQSWLCTTKADPDDDAAPEILAALDTNKARRLGFVRIPMRDGRVLEFWRRDALIGLAESGLVETLDDAHALARWKPFYGARPRNGANGTAAGGRGIAVLTSRNGGVLYGGGEHFLENAAEHHARQGFEPVIVGTRAELRGQERISNGYRCVFIGDGAADLRKFLLENAVALVHAISGMGFVAAEALNYTNIPFVYGVHFWNELLGDPQHARYFDDVTGAPSSRREFLLILSRADAVYANSRFTQKIIEDGFGVRCPIVYAVPR